MKATKNFNVENELKKIAKKIGENDTLFAIYLNEDEKDVCVLTIGDNDKNIISTIAAILEISLTGKGDEGMDRVTHIVLEALKLVQTSKSIAGLKLATEMLKSVAEKARLLDDDEDCENCEFLKTCENESAIKYRKEHGIPKPKKSDKRERKMKGGKIKANYYEVEKCEYER